MWGRLLPPADVKLFRRRERKIGTGDSVFSYAEVVPVAPFDAYGRIFKAETKKSVTLL